MNGFHRIEITVTLCLLALLGLNFLSPEVRPYWLLILAMFMIVDAIEGTTWSDNHEETLGGRLGANIGLLFGFSIIVAIVWGLEQIINPFLCLVIFDVQALCLVIFVAMIHAEENPCRFWPTRQD